MDVNLDIDALDTSFDYDVSPSNFITWNQLKSSYNRCKLSFLTVNARSLNGKFNELLCKISLLNEKFSFIVVTETHLNENNDTFEIPSYKSANFYRPCGNGGGIKLYFLEHISVKKS